MSVICVHCECICYLKTDGYFTAHVCFMHVRCISLGMFMVTSVTCISPRRFLLTRARTSAVHTSQPTILATIMNMHVPTTTSADSATFACYVTSILVIPAVCSADITNQEQDGRSTIYMIAKHIHVWETLISTLVIGLFKKGGRL